MATIERAAVLREATAGHGDSRSYKKGFLEWAFQLLEVVKADGAILESMVGDPGCGKRAGPVGRAGKAGMWRAGGRVGSGVGARKCGGHSSRSKK